MVAYRTCTGCTLQGMECAHRDAMKERIKGLGVTSIKWKCGARLPTFKPGDPAWANTLADVNGPPPEHVDDGRSDFPCVVIRLIGAKALVFIEPNVRDRYDDLPFTSKNGSGFCKIPLSRLSARDGAFDAVCRSCLMPASKGHLNDYYCAKDKS